MKRLIVALISLIGIASPSVAEGIRYHPPTWEWLPLKKYTRQFTAVQMRTLFSAPIEILPAKPGILYLAYQAIFVRNGATAFTSGSGNIQLQAVASTPIALVSRSTAFLLAAGDYTATMQLPTFAQDIDERATALGGKAVRMVFSAEDHDDGSPVTLYFWYWEVPTQGF